MNNCLLIILSSLFAISLVSFYLDDFKLSEYFFLKCIQIISFICLLFSPFIIYKYFYYFLDYENYILYIDNKDKDNINLHGHINLDKDAAKIIGQGLKTIGSQIGLGASIAGIGTAVAKGIAKSSMPPIQKAVVIVGSGLLTGLGHSMIGDFNRNNIIDNNNNIYKNKNITNYNSGSDLNKFIDNSTSSPLENILFDLEALNYICLSFVIILIIQILFKFYIKDNITLYLFKILNLNINNKLEFYLNKIIKLNKKMNNIYVWLILIELLVGLSLAGYGSGELYNNIDTYIAVHNLLKNK